MNINWQNSQSYKLTPKGVEDYASLEGAIQQEGNILVQTSGTTGASRWVALPKEALLASAEVVNKWILVTANDIWLNPLPGYHVGGLSIYARAHLGKNSVHSYKNEWSPKSFVAQLNQSHATLTSIVPTQIYDLCVENYKAPEGLRVVFVGGGNLSSSLYLRARLLGWPLLPTYGMSECGSQVATASLESLEHIDVPDLQLLPHLEARIVQERLCLRGKSLFSGYVENKEGREYFYNPKDEEGWFSTRDFVELSGGNLKFLGRSVDFVKVAGHLVNLNQLNLQWTNLNKGFGFVTSISDQRLGQRLVLVTDTKDFRACEEAVKQFNEQTLNKQSRLSTIYFLSEIPKTELGKVKMHALQI